MLPNGLRDIGVLRTLRRKVAGVVHAEIDHLFAFGLVERRRQMSGMRSDPRIPFFSVKIELRRFHWPIAAGVRRTRLLAVGIIISNGIEPCIRCTVNATVTPIDSILEIGRATWREKGGRNG